MRAAPQGRHGDASTEKYSDDPKAWRTAGPLPLALASKRRFGTEDVIRPLLPDAQCLHSSEPGMTHVAVVISKILTSLLTGTCELVSDTVHSFEATLTAAHIPSPRCIPNLASKVLQCNSIVDQEGSCVTINEWVLVADIREDAHAGALAVGHIVEILQNVDDSASDQLDCADSVLLEYYHCHGFDDRYGLPKLRLIGWVDADPKVMSYLT